MEDGKAYIEKFVQASFKIPVPMIFDLKSWLGKEVSALTKRASMAPEPAARLERALSCWCAEYISTPRDVVRVANALRQYVAPIVENIDLADGLFIQIVRIRHPEFFDWIERYVTATFAFDSSDYHSGWRDAARQDSHRFDSEFSEATEKSGDDLSLFIHDLREHLPQLGITEVSAPTDFGAEERQQYAAERRLWSSNHFRLYFSFSLPAGAVSDEEVQSFLDRCASDTVEAAHLSRQLCNVDRPQGGNKSEVLLSRILERKENISEERISGLLVVLGNTANEFARRQEQFRAPLGNPPSLYGEIVHIFRLINRLDENRRMGLLKNIFGSATSLVWLNELVMEAVKEHGFSGFKAEPEERRLLTPKEFEWIRTTFLERLKQNSAINSAETPYFLSLMYGWYLAGGQTEARTWVHVQSSKDRGFVDVLEHLKSRSASSSGGGFETGEYLARETLEMFFDSVEDVQDRLEEISLKTEYAEELRIDARRLVSSIADQKKV